MITGGTTSRSSPSTPAPEARDLASSTITALGLLAPTGVVAAIFYYFGYVSSKSFYYYYGISVSALDISSNQYFAESADALFRPVVLLVLLALALLLLDRWVQERLRRTSRRTGRRLLRASLLFAALVALSGLLGLVRDSAGAWSALGLAGAALFIEYVLSVAARHRRSASPSPEVAEPGHAVRRGLLIALALLCLFWSVAHLAAERGTSRARVIELTLSQQPQAVVYSDKDLRLNGPGIGMMTLSGDSAGYSHVYNGLRPLLYGRGRWLLLPKGWTHDNGATVIVLDDNPGHVRVDLAPGRL